MPRGSYQKCTGNVWVLNMDHMRLHCNDHQCCITGGQHPVSVLRAVQGPALHLQHMHPRPWQAAPVDGVH